MAVARTGTSIIYEWRIDLGAELVDDRVIGFDVSVADKDKDGSFSWLAWGPGTQKVDMPDRCGEFLLVRPGTELGEVSGTVAWKDGSDAILPPRVRIQSTRFAPLWREAIVDPSGSYKATHLPPGSYSIHAVDSADIRVDVGPHVDVEIRRRNTGEGRAPSGRADPLARADRRRRGAPERRSRSTPRRSTAS